MLARIVVGVAGAFFALAVVWQLFFDVTGGVAFLLSIVVTLLAVSAILVYKDRRPVGTPLSWGEALLASTFVFLIMFFAYGVVPHQWLNWADSQLSWRADRLLSGPGQTVPTPFTVTYRTLRDLVAAGIYVVLVTGQIFLHLHWQNRGRVKPQELETSRFGRPLVKVS